MRHSVCVLALCAVCLGSDQASQPSLTIYNQNFAVVRQDLPLDLKAGENSVRVTDITMHLGPDSTSIPFRCWNKTIAPIQYLIPCCSRSTTARP